MNVLEEWLNRVATDLGLDPDETERDAVLDLTRDVAHGVARPAAPLTAYLVGLAAGRAGGTPDDVNRTIATATSSVRQWAADHPHGPDTGSDQTRTHPSDNTRDHTSKGAT